MSDDLTRSFNGSVDEKLDRIPGIVESMDSRLLSFETKVANLEPPVQGTDSRLTNLGEKVEARLRETQPLWERVFTEITELRKDMRLGLRKVERQIMQLSKDFLEHRADLVMLEGDNI